MQVREPDNPALAKYAQVGRLLCENQDMNDADARSALIELLNEWSERLQLARLNSYGISTDDFPRIVADSRGSSMQTNPIKLTDEEIKHILVKRL
jgi:alcohol dehydrogenase